MTVHLPMSRRKNSGCPAAAAAAIHRCDGRGGVNSAHGVLWCCILHMWNTNTRTPRCTCARVQFREHANMYPVMMVSGFFSVVGYVAMMAGVLFGHN